MATFEKDTWVWVPDPTECFLPAKVNAPFNQGSAGAVTFEDGTTKDLSAAESKECQQMDEQSLQTLENMVHFNGLKDAVLVQAEVLFFSSADTGLTAVLSLLAFCAAA